jgi:predicted ribosomally synthesized peptide with SipW-like signal peptide
MKKILFSILIIAVVAAVAAGGTVAYFSASQTITGTVSAGTITLAAGVGDYNTKSFTLSGMLPGQSQTFHTLIKNPNSYAIKILPAYSKTWGSDDLAKAIEVTWAFGGRTETKNLYNLWTGAEAFTIGATDGIPANTELDVTTTFKFVDNGADQNALQNASLGCKFVVEARPY